MNMKFEKQVRLSLAVILLLGLSGCSKSDMRNQLMHANQPILSERGWQGKDFYADIYLCPEWIAERRVVSLTLPDGKTDKVQLTSEMESGASLRLKGRAPKGGVGDLYLVVRIVN
jgi:hypothetical protein